MYQIGAVLELQLRGAIVWGVRELEGNSHRSLLRRLGNRIVFHLSVSVN